jgi:hypothetical protein
MQNDGAERSPTLNISNDSIYTTRRISRYIIYIVSL